MNEWIDPRYAALVETMRVQANQETSRQGLAAVRGFVVADPEEN
ncbi:hypothetical protein ACF059_17500 [Streptomyces sp. NPDC016562]